MAYYCKYGGECYSCGMCQSQKCYLCDRIFSDGDLYLEENDNYVCSDCAKYYDFSPEINLKYYGAMN